MARSAERCRTWVREAHTEGDASIIDTIAMKSPETPMKERIDIPNESIGLATRSSAQFCQETELYDYRTKPADVCLMAMHCDY